MKESLAKNLLFSTVILVLFFFALELGLRGALRLVFGYERYENFQAKYGLLEGPLYHDRELKGRANNLGFEKPDFNFKKSPKTFRVLMIGGSAVAGELSRIFRGELEKNCPTQNCEVIDGGSGGSVSTHEAYNLKRWIHYAPNLIIVYDGWNDMYYSHYTQERYLTQNAMFERLIHKWDTPYRIFLRNCVFMKVLKWIRGWLEERNFEKLVYADHGQTMDVSWMGGVTSYKIPKEDFTVRDMFSSLYKKNLLRIAETAERQETKVIFVLQPSLGYLMARDGAKGYAENLLKNFRNEVRNDWLRAVKSFHPAAVQAQKEAQQSHLSPFYDFNDWKDLKQEFFTDFVHLSTDGSKWAAQKLIEVCRKEKLL